MLRQNQIGTIAITNIGKTQAEALHLRLGPTAEPPPATE
jgi:hypothetical protein